MSQHLCPKCQAPLTPDYVGVHYHLENDCLKQQLLNTQEEIKALKASVLAWKDGWFRQRDATGANYWNGFLDGKKSW